MSLVLLVFLATGFRSIAWVVFFELDFLELEEYYRIGLVLFWGFQRCELIEVFIFQSFVFLCTSDMSF